jgi:hypothetical protein
MLADDIEGRSNDILALTSADLPGLHLLFFIGVTAP